VMNAENINIVLYEGGQKSTAISADKGFVNSGAETWKSPSIPILEPGDMFLNGDVVVISTDGTKVTTDWINYKKQAHIIVSTAPVQMDRENSVTKGRGLEATADLKSVNIFNQTVVIDDVEE